MKTRTDNEDLIVARVKVFHNIMIEPSGGFTRTGLPLYDVFCWHTSCRKNYVLARNTRDPEPFMEKHVGDDHFFWCRVVSKDEQTITFPARKGGSSRG